jgi:hypothetical protein
MLPSPITEALRQLSFDELSSHRLLGLATSRFILPSEWRERGEERLFKNLQRQAVLAGLLDDIGLDRRARTLPIGLLKGTALWGDIYKPGEREAADIDLFVAEKDHSSLHTLLLDLQFEKIQQSVCQANDFKSLYLSERFGDLSIEVHTKLWWREPRDFRWSWRAAERAPFVRLTVEDQFIHLCGHWIAQHTMISLHWLFDLLLFLEKYHDPMDWTLLRSRAKALRLSRAVDLACELAKQIQEPGGFHNLDSALINFDFLTQPKANPWRYFLIKHTVQESFTDAFRYDFEWLRQKLRLGSGDVGR